MPGITVFPARSTRVAPAGTCTPAPLATIFPSRITMAPFSTGAGRTARRTLMKRIALVFVAAAVLTSHAAEAQITRIVIDPGRSESPTFDGRMFGPNGSVGQYEKLRGKAYGEVDPADPRNAVITDLTLAPRNARGKVEYSMDIFILKPIDLKKGNHKLLLDFNNRGR